MTKHVRARVEHTFEVTTIIAAVTWLKYCWYAVKLLKYLFQFWIKLLLIQNAFYKFSILKDINIWERNLLNFVYQWTYIWMQICLWRRECIRFLLFHSILLKPKHPSRVKEGIKICLFHFLIIFLKNIQFILIKNSL